MKAFHDQLITHITPTMLDDMLRHSFFLPADVLELATKVGWKIEPVKLADSEEFKYALPIFKDEATHYEAQPSQELVIAAKRVGVSYRYHEGKNKTYIITKLWME
jgi:hypothetical protein